MVDIVTDKYILGQSQSQSLNLPGGEIRLDLKLSLDGNDNIGGIVKGVVQDTLSAPIEGALVKLMTTTYDPVMHAITDSTGSYVLNNVPIDTTFNIYAIAPGKQLNEGTITATTLTQTLGMDFTLEDDPDLQLVLIAGDVLDLTEKTPVGGATASLYSINGSTQTLAAVANSNQYGQFTFRGVALGSYSVTVTAFGYNANSVSVTASSAGQIIPLNISLTQDPNSSLGTVSGVINDDTGNSIARADVILYRVETDNRLTPIAFTKTNSEGVYLFENVPQATYKIKSNESTIVTVPSPDSPNYYGFAVANASTLVPTVTDITDANLENGAIYVLNNTFVASLGGVTGGTMGIGITSLFDGYFNFSITYLSGNSNTTIIMQSDPDNNGTQTTLDFPKTNSWNVTDAMTITTKMPLYSGQNQFLFFNNANTASPWIGGFSMVYVPYSFTVDPTTGTASNGAISILPFVTMLGGPKNGAIDVPVNIPFSEPYKLGIRYLAGDEDRPLKLDINGTNQANFTVPRTNDWSSANAKIYELKIQADQGTDDFKFYNDTGHYAPNIGTLTFSEYTVNVSFLPKDVILLNGPTIQTDTNRVSYIGGVVQGSGTVQFVVNVYETQLHDFVISYSCQDDRICNVSVNGGAVDYVEFHFPATGGSVQTFSCQLFLTEGSNTIAIYND